MGVNTIVNLSATVAITNPGETVPSSPVVSSANPITSMIPTTPINIKVRSTPLKSNDNKERTEKTDKMESVSTPISTSVTVASVATAAGGSANQKGTKITTKSLEDFYKELQQFHERRG